MVKIMKNLSKSKYLKTTAAAALSIALAGTFIVSGPLSAISEARADPVQVSGVKQTGFADLVEQVRPAVVSVRVKQAATDVIFDGNIPFGPRDFDMLPDNHPFKRFFRDFGGIEKSTPDYFTKRPKAKRHGKPRVFGQGSGFFISDDGYIVTNNHVVADGSSLSVVLDDGTELDAKLVGADPRTDLAVLKVDEPDTKFTYVDFGDDNEIRVGDWVVAVGNPFGLGGTVTSGIVSGRGRDIGAGPYDDFIQIDAAVNKGNSGGPAFNLSGQVIGINTAIFSPSGGNVGIAFAIPASTAKKVVNQLVEKGSVERGWIGVQIQPVTKDVASSLGLTEDKGALVAAASKDGPADKAQIKSGDVITALNGEVIQDPRDLSRKIAAVTPDEEINLTVWRDGKSRSIEVTVSSMPDDIKANKPEKPGKKASAKELEIDDFGISVADTKNGVAISDIDPDGVAAERGIKPGDIVVSINNKEVSKASEVSEFLTDVTSGKKKAVLIQLKSDDQTRFVALPTPK